MISVICFVIGLLSVVFATVTVVREGRRKTLNEKKSKAIGYFLIVCMWFIASLVSYLIGLP